MAQLEEVSAWLAQAEADLNAARVEDARFAECHRRYWIQQGYEKAIKAYALIRWNGSSRDLRFRMDFLLKHSPLKSIGATASLTKELYLLGREVESFVRGLGDAGLLMKIDDLETSSRPDQVSYRYPFRLQGGAAELPPSEYSDWEACLGNRMGSTAAVERLIRKVRGELRIARRRPR